MTNTMLRNTARNLVSRANDLGDIPVDPTGVSNAGGIG